MKNEEMLQTMIIHPFACAIITFGCGLYQFIRYMDYANKSGGEFSSDGGRQLYITIILLVTLWSISFLELSLIGW